MELAARLHVGDVRDAVGDAVEVVEVEFHMRLVGQRQEVQHRVRRPAERRRDGDRVLEGLLRHDLTRRDPEAQQVDDRRAGSLGIALTATVDRRRRRGARQAHPDRLGDRTHRVGREHAATRALAGTRGRLDLVEFLLGHRARGARPHRLEHARDVGRHPVVLARHGRTVVDEHAREVEAGGSHQHRRDRLVAAREPDEAVEALGVHHGLDRVGDHLARHERGAHPLVAHRDAVADGDRSELEREAAGLPNADLGVLGELAQRHVARGDLVPRRRDRDLRLVPVVVAHPDGAQHRPRRRLLHAVGDVARPRLDVDRSARCVRGIAHGLHGSSAHAIRAWCCAHHSLPE